MKKFVLLLAVSMLLVAVGCPGNEPQTASETRSAGAQNVSGGSDTQQSIQTDAHSSGGSALPASLPYSQPSAPAASQNLNAGPFLTSAESHGAGQAPAQPWAPGLTSRADGTMYGPSDQPAAGSGQGISPAPEGKERQNKQSPQKVAPGAAKPAQSRQPGAPKQ